MYSLKEHGFEIHTDPQLIKNISDLKSLFAKNFLEQNDDNEMVGRNRISLFAREPKVAEYLLSLNQYVSKTVKWPIYCGPCVTHFTSNAPIGNGYGLGFHQDWPSMASSDNSLVAWTSLTACGSETHGLELCVASHKNGLLPGNLTKSGYIISDHVVDEYETFIPDLPDGGLVLFSPYLVHRTYVNDSYYGYKLAISQRFDDLQSEQWRHRGYPCAYRTSVDRTLYLKFTKELEV